MASQARFLDFLDMIDGGGAGQMGDTFEGGGIFSALANLMATPYGSEDAGRRASREEFLRGRGLLDEPAVASAAPAMAPAMTGPTRAQRMSAATAEMARQRGMQQDSLDPRGPNQMGMPAMGMPPAPSYAMMDMGEAGRGSMPNQFTGPTYDMPMARPAAPAMSPAPDYAMMGMGEAGRGMPMQSQRQYPASLVQLYSRDFLDQLDDNALNYLLKMQ